MQDNINNIKTFKQEANIDNYDELCSWIEKTRAEWNISKELANKIDICVEEVFANSEVNFIEVIVIVPSSRLVSVKLI